jgi:aldehyde dehydrogenase (NAD+)
MTATDREPPAPDLLMLVNGARTAARSGRTYASTDPFTGQPWAHVPDAAAADVDDAVAAARAALAGPWGQLTATQRGRLLHRLGDLIARDAGRLAELETRDNGKLLREMSGQLAGLPDWYYYYAGLADKVQGSVIPSDKPGYLVYTLNEPAGVVAAIVPWNSPLLLLTWKLAPALAAGCTIVVKPSDYTPVSTLALAGLVTEAGFPPGVVNVVTGWGPETGKALAAHPDVDKIAFTGSTQVGKLIAHAAADNLTRLTLELGGKSAQVVFPDADLDAAANGVIAGVFAATGQTCMAGSRVLVHEDVQEALVERVVRRARAIRLGNPLDPETEMGPMATDKQYATVLSHFDSARAEGATIACGGQPAGRLGGWFVEPTVLVDATAGRRSRKRSSARSSRSRLSGPRRRPSPWPTAPGSGWPARSGPRTCTARTGSRPACAPARCGSMPTGWSARSSRSAALATAAWAGRTASTRFASTPRPSPCGWS